MSMELTPHDSAVRADRATQLALTLARELWVVKDRLLVLEAVLASEGFAGLSARVDAFQPDAATRAAIDAERKRIALSMKREIAGTQGAHGKPASPGKDKSAKHGPQSFSAGPAKPSEDANPFAALKNLKLN